jgi:diacylglycerol kinase (ATP)
VTRARLVVNPASGADRAMQLLPVVATRLRTVVETLEITISTGAGDIERAAADAVREHCEALYLAGGDGTLNAALRGLVGAEDPMSWPVIGVVPLGTGNDFAKAIGLGEDPEAAIDLLLARRSVAIDVGMLNDRPFVNVSAGGFVAQVSEAVSEGLKDAMGKMAYLIGGARALLGSESFSATLDVTGPPGADPGHWSGEVRMFAACNARFAGGGYPVAPSACLDDGLLDMLVVPAMTLMEFVGVLQRIAAGDESDDGGVMHFRASAADFTFDRPVRVNTDGEVLDASRCSYRVRSSVLRCFCGSSPLTHARPVEPSGDS